MPQAKDFLKNSVLNENEKNKRWENIVTARLKWWDNEYKRLNKSKYFSADQKDFISKEIHQMKHLETDGGKCPKCYKEWSEKKFDNVFGSGRYFKPGCQCYFKCPRCKKHLYDLYVTTRLKMKKYTCPGCGWVLLFDGDTRFGPKYEDFYDSQLTKPKNINIAKAIKDKKDKKKKEKKAK